VFKVQLPYISDLNACRGDKVEKSLCYVVMCMITLSVDFFSRQVACWLKNMDWLLDTYMQTN